MTSESSIGVTVRPRDTSLTVRALDYLAGGPADARTLIAHVCQAPTMPAAVAEHMAAALFAGHGRFVREPDGRWHLARDAAMPAVERLAGLSFAVVDVEATGSRMAGGDRITEVAVVEVKSGVATTLVDTLVNPQRIIPPFISSLTNINAHMVRHAPVFSEICDQLLGALDGRLFVAHNANFDWRFLNMEIERATGRTLAGRRLCTVRLVRKVLPQLRRRSLDYVAMHYGIEIIRRHRAGDDAVATARVLIRLLDDARHDGCETWHDLQHLLIRPIPKRHRRRRSPALPRPVDKDTTA